MNFKKVFFLFSLGVFIISIFWHDIRELGGDVTTGKYGSLSGFIVHKDIAETAESASREVSSEPARDFGSLTSSLWAINDSCEDIDEILQSTRGALDSDSSLFKDIAAETWLFNFGKEVVAKFREAPFSGEDLEKYIELLNSEEIEDYLKFELKCSFETIDQFFLTFVESRMNEKRKPLEKDMDVMKSFLSSKILFVQKFPTVSGIHLLVTSISYYIDYLVYRDLLMENEAEFLLDQIFRDFEVFLLETDEKVGNFKGERQRPSQQNLDGVRLEAAKEMSFEVERFYHSIHKYTD